MTKMLHQKSIIKVFFDPSMLRSSKLVFLSAAKDLGRRPKNRHSSALSAMSETPAPTSVSSAPSPDPKSKPAGSNARTAPRPDRMSRLQDLPRLKSEAQTIRVMVEEFCSYHHGTSGHMLCPKCQAFLDYALKRLACCPARFTAINPPNGKPHGKSCAGPVRV